MHERLDRPVVPRNGQVRVHITAVVSPVHYYARIGKYRGQDNQLIDTSASHWQVANQMKQFYSAHLQPTTRAVDVGALYARRSHDGIFERICVESVVDYDYEVSISSEFNFNNLILFF